MTDRTSERELLRVRDGAGQTERGQVVREEPLEILVDAQPYVVVMRTPGDETALAAGLLLAEGIITDRSDLATIEFCGSAGGNQVRVQLRAERRAATAHYRERKTFLSRSSCGLCGKEMIDEIADAIRPATQKVVATPAELARCLETLSAQQELRALSKGTHAVGIFTRGGEMISFAEDVGRHNAMDKAVGRLVLFGKLGEAAICVASSRASFEMAQKAAAAGIPILATVSAPTDLAIDLAERAGMTLTCHLRGNQMNVYTGAGRIRLESQD